MRVIEFMVQVQEGGIVKIPKGELETAGIEKGDLLCISYLSAWDDLKKENAKEFLLQKTHKDFE